MSERLQRFLRRASSGWRRERAATLPEGHDRFDAPDGAGFVERVTSRAMWTRYEEMRRECEDVLAIEYMLGRPRVLEWVHSVGVVQDQVLRSLVPPLPPLELRSITADPPLAAFLWTGLVDIQQVVALYERHRRGPVMAHPAVLDFGCGCGRLSRFLGLRPDRWSASACDVNPAHVRWCQDHLPVVRSHPVGVRPPAPFHDATFVLIYALSVFTHLPEDRAGEWIRELARLLVLGGVLVLTTHGLPALQTIATSLHHQKMFALTPGDVAQIVEQVRAEIFHYRPYAAEVVRLAQAGEDYGNAFVHPRYVEARWASDELELVEHLPGGLRGWQDIAVLRRR